MEQPVRVWYNGTDDLGGGVRMAHILAVDDEQDILVLIRNVLALDGHCVTVMSTPSEVVNRDLRLYDLILLDIAMPGMDGFALCEQIRTATDCPILFLSAKTREADVIYGLGVGADDYLRKPFATEELRARVSAHLRREAREKKSVMRIGDVSFDLMGKRLLVNGHQVSLTPGEYGICLMLARNRGQVFTKDRLYEAVFGYDKEGSSEAISEHVSNIRYKLKLLGVAPIETVWGMGYKWQG